jgi:hypothetical protein
MVLKPPSAGQQGPDATQQLLHFVAVFVAICFILLQIVANCCVFVQQILTEISRNRVWTVGWLTEMRGEFFDSCNRRLF